MTCAWDRLLTKFESLSWCQFTKFFSGWRSNLRSWIFEDIIRRSRLNLIGLGSIRHHHLYLQNRRRSSNLNGWTILLLVVRITSRNRFEIWTLNGTFLAICILETFYPVLREWAVVRIRLRDCEMFIWASLLFALFSRRRRLSNWNCQKPVWGSNRTIELYIQFEVN